jgi:hypothetical protein
MGTVARQTIWPLINAKEKTNVTKRSDEGRRPGVLNTCHAWSSDSNLVKIQAPSFYTGDG